MEAFDRYHRGHRSLQRHFTVERTTERSSPEQLRHDINLNTSIHPLRRRAQARAHKVQKDVAAFSIFKNVHDNLVADLKFWTKIIARCSALSTVALAYFHLPPRMVIAATLVNIGLSLFSDICDKELRERQEKRTN